jgi:hypothetical protein
MGSRNILNQNPLRAEIKIQLDKKCSDLSISVSSFSLGLLNH